MTGKTAHPAIAEEEVVDLELEPFIKMVSGCGKLLKVFFFVFKTMFFKIQIHHQLATV